MEKKLKDAIDYIMNNPTLSFHNVAIKFEVNVQKLQDEYTKEYKNKKDKR